jgi:hypothetical protein
MEERVMKELTELVIRFKDIVAEIGDLQDSFDGNLCNFPSCGSVQLLEAYFLKHISSFSVRTREPASGYELYTRIKGIEVFCLVTELPKGCEL